MSNVKWYGDKVLATVDEAIEKFLYASAITIQRDAVNLCKVDTGHLRRSITYEVDKNKKQATIGTNVHYALHLEYGTKPHTIKVKNAKVLADKKGNVFGKSVKHPGTRAQPFLRPALDNNKKNLSKMAQESLNAYLGGKP